MIFCEDRYSPILIIALAGRGPFRTCVLAAAVRSALCDACSAASAQLATPFRVYAILNSMI